MDLHEIFSIDQWANRYEVTLNLTQPHLPSFVMTYHDLPTQLKQILKDQPKINILAKRDGMTETMFQTYARPLKHQRCREVT